MRPNYVRKIINHEQVEINVGIPMRTISDPKITQLLDVVFRSQNFDTNLSRLSTHAVLSRVLIMRQ